MFKKDINCADYIKSVKYDVEYNIMDITEVYNLFIIDDNDPLNELSESHYIVYKYLRKNIQGY